MKEGIEKLYSYRKNFLVIGLTGRTGSGCSTVANFLSKSGIDIGFSDYKITDPRTNEDRKQNIIKHFSQQNWQQFYCIRAKDIITAYILENSYEDFLSFLNVNLFSEQNSSSYIQRLASIEQEFKILHNLRTKVQNKETELSAEITEEKIKEKFDFHFKLLPSFTDKLKQAIEEASNSEFTSIFQSIGNNIRSSGNAFKEDPFTIQYADAIVSKMNKLIKLIKKSAEFDNKKCLIVLDALRNPFEVYFLRERYNSFYLLSINTDDEHRRERLGKLGVSTSSLDKLDQKEYPKNLIGKDLYLSQDIQRCIEISDIHINNPQNQLKTLHYQILLYYSLIMKPGLVPPTASERVMQLAYSAKSNSGCISRQVGAAITDKNFSIKAIGWNNTPQFQVPCLLRNSENLFNMKDLESFSKYEQNNSEFRNLAIHALNDEKVSDYQKCGNNISYCFKDIQNSLEGEKNQVHTRSLHAEENAFLQLSKYGNSGIENGNLFTTASPCELCSKKAYQLGIRKIYYIDPYPGIATSHILNGGTNNPELILFKGAIGSAYFKLYNPLLPYKDEIKQATGLFYKKKESVEVSSLKAEIRHLQNELDNQKKVNDPPTR
ncbi:hypothetical protein [Lunatibacter salilacus]|uniref:hypothetical protein n=1 Tax=Lunatibacter salilacus TaxID=2483804 RepID=UPI00131E96B4|nr:hypothetical protein [Lunatibacter salilacus]